MTSASKPAKRKAKKRKARKTAKPKASKTVDGLTVGSPVIVKLPGKPGRPSEWTEELAKEICRRLAEVGNLRAVCRAEDMPSEATVRTWALDDREGFSAQYTRARELGYLSMADELTEISDDASGDVKTDGEGNDRMDAEFVGRSRLKLDTRKWLLSKALPKFFGDKLAHTGADGGAIKVEEEIVIIELVAEPIPAEMLDDEKPDADADEE